MPGPYKLAHYVLNSYDAQRLAEWYCTCLHGQIVYRNPPVIFMSYDDEHHRIGFAQMKGTPCRRDPTQPGLQHVAFTYASTRDLLARYEELKAVGILPKVTTNHGPTVSFYYVDPDGNILEKMVDRFATMQAARDFMNGPIFARNPVGFELDPEQMLARLKAGATEQELLEYHETSDDPWALAARQRAALGSPPIARD
jgi:catechol 2,3-dioxygenase-like lactoylglutathione lyase family enzyme